TLSPASSDTITVAFEDAGTGTATSGTDYTAITAGTLTFDPNETEKTIDVTVNGDSDTEPDETVVIKLSGPNNAQFADGETELTGAGTIRSDESFVVPSAVTGLDAEGDDGTTTITFSVSIWAAQRPHAVTVRYRDVTATAGVSNPAGSGTDYTAISDGVLEFAPGDQYDKTVEVSVIGDRDEEPDEAIVLEFYDPTGAVFQMGATTERLTASIPNDDGTSSRRRNLSIDSPSVAEGDDGTTTLTFTVERSGSTDPVVKVDYAVAEDSSTATAGEDYVAISTGALTFESGEASKTIDVTVNADTVAELDETVVITLSNPYNAQFAGDAPTVSGTGTITNDDQAVLTIEGSSVDEGDGEDGEVRAELEFTVRLSGPVADTVTVQIADAGTGTATASEDYVAFGHSALTFDPGETRTTVLLDVHGDTTVEHHETVVIVLSNPINAVFAGGAETVTGTGTIRSDDGTPAPPVDTSGTPVADAGGNLDVDPEAPVALDGSGSADPDGDTLTFAWSRASGAAVTLAGTDTAAPSFTAPWQPGDLVFRLTVTDPDGLAASDDVTVTVRDLAPGFGPAAVSSPALVLGEAMETMGLPEATGGNGALTYSLTSVPAGLAGLSFDPATRRLSGTPTEEGSYVFTYRAEDADANRTDPDAAVLTFGVTVEDPRTALLRKTMKRTLAAVARRALSSALENIGARFASSIPDSGLTLAGTTLRLDAARGPDMVGVSDMDGAAGRCAAWSHRHGFRAGTDGCPAVGMQNRDVKADELLRTSAFSLTLGAAEGSGPGGSPVPLWAVWGRGDLGTFAGRPEPGMRYDGELRTGWLGIDARAGPWVAGLAFSHGKGEADYGFDRDGLSGQGRLETALNAFYPYGRWTIDEGLELRAVLGAGTGEARHVLDEGEAETSDLAMRMASVGLRRELPALGEFDLAVRADASIARLETDSGPQFIDNLTADTWRGRVGLEASRHFVLGEDAALTPFVEAAGRGDGGDGLTGAGIELAGGVRYRAPGLEVEARGRWLAAHVEEGARERGVSVTARVGPGAHGRGLSLLLAPRWGAETGRADALWSEELPRLSGGTGDDAASLDARMGYGLALAPQGLLTPFAETALTGGERRRLRLGTRFDATGADLGVELAGERRESAAAEPEHALTLDVFFRFCWPAERRRPPTT
ncbi:MAG: PKD domain-containing protein, partial [Rhodospirillales bacterium]|nr:PKD domain-containing protein [Rhodospirillales bacterium]